MNPRVVREVVTERDLLHIDGSFFELPARNAGGMPYVRPISTHNFAIMTTVRTGVCCASLDWTLNWPGRRPPVGMNTSSSQEMAKRPFGSESSMTCGCSASHEASVAPGRDSLVKAGVPSDPYLMTGYDRKSVLLSHDSQGPVEIRLEVDIDGTGLWVPYMTFGVQPGQTVRHTFPDGFSAYWVRAVSGTDTMATVQLEYR